MTKHYLNILNLQSLCHNVIMISSDSIIITSKLLNASTYQNISFNSESVIINQNKFLCLDLNCNISSFDLEASKVVLYFYENGNSNTSVEIYKCSSGGITSGNPINYQTSLISGKRRFMVDVSNEILPNFNGHHYFAIKSINNFSIFVGLLSLYKPYATFDTINIFDFYYHNYYEPRHLNYSLKNDDFSINLFSGAIDYFNELASVNNKLYSFKLLINYHSNMYGQSSVHNYQTYLPNGWKFSFQQFIVSYLNNKYIYIDENNKRHIFSSFKIDNDYEYYFDTCGGYLILKKDLYSGAFEIMLPNKEILTFSNFGYLTSHKLNTRNKDVTIKFQYSNNRISNISCLNDNVNKILFSFFYLNDGINIKVFNDSNKIISLNFNNNDLSYISYQDGSTLSYIYNNHYLISASYKNVKIDFTYDNKNRISSINKNNNYLSATNDFDLINNNIYYLDHLSKVETIINNLSSFKRTYIYEYDDNLDAINEFELYNDDISGAISNIHQNNKHSSYFSNSSVIGKIIDSNNHEINYINNPIILSDSSIHELRMKVINSKILPVLYFILKTTSSTFLDSTINISILYNGVSFYSKNITITSKYNISTLFIPFALPSNVNDYDSIKLKINRVGLGANIEINDIKLLFQKSEEMLEVSNLYGTSIPLGAEDNNLYLLNQSIQVIYGDNIAANISINFDDLLYSILINKIYNLNVLFTNFGKNILLNIISINNVSLNEIIIGKISYAPTYYKENNNPDLLRSSYHLSTFKYDNQNLKFLNEEIGYEFITSYRSVKQYIIDLFLQIEKEIDFNHNEETTHSYNDYGSSAYSLLLRKVVVNNVIESNAYLKTNQLSYSSNGELLTSINTKIDNNNYFDIVYTYDNYFNLIKIKNDQLNEYYIYYDYYNNDLLKSVYLLNSNLEEISKTNIIYSQGQIEEINNDYLTYNYLNNFSYIYQKDNEMSSLTWNNNATYFNKYMNLDTIYNDITACFIQDDKETIYDYHGNILYNSSSLGVYSLSYFYRERSESLEDVIYENRVSKLDDLLGGEFDHFTNILKEYEYDIYDNISKTKVRKLANLNDYYISSTYIDDNDYDLEISYSYDAIDAYFGVFINQCIKDKYQTREEKVFNNYVNDMGPFKSNIYYSNYPNNIIHKISDNLYHGLNNASSVYDEFIKDDDLNNVHTYQKRHYFNSDNETNHHTSFINNEVLEVCNNNIYPPSLIKTINYCYDNHGYINQISSDSSSYNFSHQYTYSNNRLVSDNSASFGNKQYLYNVLGNITSIIINNNHSYTFYYGSNSDSNNFKNNQISSFYHDGNHYYFSYDNNGFPTLYKNINVLFSNKKLTNYGDVSFSYDSYNKRISKVVANNQEILYIYQLDKLIYEIRKVNNIQTVIEYIYGVNDIIGFKYQGNYYIYHKDILGNIVAIYSSGSLVAKYDYDAYGNHIVYNADGTINNNPSFIGNINPFRYRGYYFDVETGLYYLQYRYYDPEIGRFISPDSFEHIEVDKINGTNLYIYCYNNPIMYKDPSGHMSALAAVFILGLIGATIGFAAQSLTDLASEKGFDWRRSLISAGAGFVGGMFSAIPFWVPSLSAALTSGLNTVGQMAYSSGGNCEIGDYVFGFLISAAAGYVSSRIFGKIFNNYSFFESTNFFLDNFIGFVTNSDGITLSNSVIAQFICQLAPRAVVVGLANSFFDLPFSWAADSFFNFGKRIFNQGIKNTFKEIFAL